MMAAYAATRSKQIYFTALTLALSRWERGYERAAVRCN